MSLQSYKDKNCPSDHKSIDCSKDNTNSHFYNMWVLIEFVLWNQLINECARKNLANL